MKKKKCFRFLSALFAVMILATSAGFNVDAATSNGTKKPQPSWAIRILIIHL